jgi:hypothetical protein
MTTATPIHAWRELGRERLNICNKAKTPEEWQQLWQEPKHPFAMTWGDCWVYAPCYHVEDFEAEVGFWLDVLGFTSNALTPDFCMVMPPDGKFTFSVRPADDERQATSPGALTLEFMVKDIHELAATLAQRGVPFEQEPQPCGSPDSPMHTAIFTTPAGIRVWLWGMTDKPSAAS